MKYDIFISYRRSGGYETAKHLYDLLTRDGYKVSFDIDSLRNDDFDTALLKRIDECTDFILIVDSHCFDRTLNPDFNPKDDWLRQELAYALKNGKNIIPILLKGIYTFPNNLPKDIAGITKKNRPEYNQYYFDAFYEKIKTHFLLSSPIELPPRPTIPRKSADINPKTIVDPEDKDTSLGNRIYISYKRVDKARTFEIRNQIESQIGKECWIDLEGIESNAQFMNVIIRAINECEVFLFMYSKAHSEIHDFERDWTVRELNFASSKNKRIIFVTIDGTPLTDEFIFNFGMKPQVDGRSPYALNLLIRDLRIWLNIPTEVDYSQQKSQEAASDADELFDKARNYQRSGDYSNAVECFRAAAEKGHSGAQFRLGVCYYNGTGVPKDYDEAVKWYRKSAEQGYAEAQYNLGLCYYNGIGVVRDYAETVKWYRKAAEQDDEDAQYLLGLCFYYGTGVEKDYTEAKNWLKLAAQKGRDGAKEWLSNFK